MSIPASVTRCPRLLAVAAVVVEGLSSSALRRLTSTAPVRRMAHARVNWARALCRYCATLAAAIAADLEVGARWNNPQLSIP
jgi:hypothetical protein